MQLKGKWVAAAAASTAVVALLAVRGCGDPPPAATANQVAVAPASPTTVSPDPVLEPAVARPVEPTAPAKAARPATPAVKRAARAPAPPVQPPAPVTAATSAPAASSTTLPAALPASPPAEVARAVSPAGPPAATPEEPSRFSFGVQVAALAPVAGDLPTTSGFPVSGSIGLHVDWRVTPRQTVRPRVDAALFWEGQQTGSAPPLTQELTTRVSSVGIGADYLYRPGGEEGRFAVGAHAAAIRWAVRSASTITVAGGGASTDSGTASWWRPGFGPVCEYRLGRQLSAEARLIFSSYGKERLAANTASLGLLWGF
jgi:hypothetical protein